MDLLVRDLRAFVFSADLSDLSEREPGAHHRGETTVGSEPRSHAGGDVRADTDAADRLLVECIRASDERAAKAAFDTLYDTLYVRLVHFAARLVNDAETAHDIVQDVFVALWLARANWQAPGGSAPYLYSAVRNRALKRLRHDTVVRRTSDALLPVPTALSLPDANAEGAEFDAALSLALAELPERRRTAFLLRIVDDLGYDAIGTILGISGPAAYKQVVAAVRTLREQLSRFGG